MKKIYLITIVLLLATAFNTKAQKWKRVRYEVLYGLGASNAMTDLGGANEDGRHMIKDFEFSTIRPVAYVGARYKIKEALAVKLTMSFTYVTGDDALTKSEGRKNRNVSFSSPLFETALQAEFSIIKEKFGNRYTFSNMRKFKLTNVNTYLFAGVGGFFFNPTTINQDYPSNKNESFGKMSVAFPLGIGFKYGINRKLSLGMEIGPRFTLTDYLDGFSDVNSKANDSYMFLLFNLNYKLRTARSGFPRF